MVLASPFRIGIGAAARRNLVYVDDVTRSIARAEEIARLSGRHLVSGDNVTQDELEREVRTAAGMQPGRRIGIPRVAARTAAGIADAVLRFDKASGWKRRVATLLAPWCVRPNVLIDGIAGTAFPDAVRQTVDALRKEAV